MRLNRLATPISVFISTLFAAPLAYATNGMNLDAYGALAGGMGGASYAYDASNSAIMSNPATLGLKKDNTNNLGIGITMLMPDVSSSHPMAGESASSGNLYLMPSMSFIKRAGNWVFGAGVLAQGGMGTEYGAGSNLFAGGMSMMGTPAAMSGEDIRSEVGVGRLMFPVTYKVTEAISVAAQVDYVWATMDVKMDIDGSTFSQMLQPNATVGSASGSLVNTLGGMIQAGQISNVNYARYEFSDNNDFSGAAKGQGFAGKLGFHFKVSENFMIGATYHTKTYLDDLDASNAKVQMGVVMGGQTMTVPVTGKISVLNFQWPETYGFGVSWKPTNELMLVSDIKFLRWASAMKDFSMRFTANDTQANPMAQGLVSGGGTELTSTLHQNWENQTVIMVGGQYMVLPGLALRLGYNYADNPVPDATLNPLFPAIEKSHYTLGFGWRINQANSLAASLTIAPKVEATNPNTGITSYHSQSVFRANYNYTF